MPVPRPHLILAVLCTSLLLATAPCALARDAQATAAASDAAAALPFAQPRAGLYSAGQPSATQLAQAAAAGITTVIDLRGPNEDRGYDEQASAEAHGLRYVRLPIAGGSELTADNARVLHRLLAQDNGAVLLHCASGNRAGGLLALAAAHYGGADAEAAMALGRAAGLTSLAPLVQRQLDAAAAAGSAEDAARHTPAKPPR